ncbi:MAG: phosphate ABC transporter substrate-binding protein [Candidatus Cloacimonetes bacterium]|nr:phosphate ABC transporter substrate-binding protein [Candidatus Cloacimonadota bacterium]
MKLFACIVLIIAMLPLVAVEKVTMDGSTTVGPIAKAFAQYYMSNNPGVKVEVSESGSGNGAKAIMNGSADIGNMSRFMKPSEFSAAVERGVFPVAHVIALDGIAIIVNKVNSVTDLSLDQIRDIYSGKITNWNQVGGPNMDIVIISRESNSGTLDTFKHFVMKYKVNGEKKTDAISSRAESQGSNGAVLQCVTGTRGAIGFVGLGFINNSIKALSIGGIKATVRNVKNGRYPIGRPLFMFTNGYPLIGSHVYNIVTLHLTPAGEQLIRDAGYIPVTAYK